MILPFSTQLNGKPTLFIEKIWEGFFRNDFFGGKDTEFIKYFDLHKEKFGRTWDELPADNRLEFPKIHTIRKDEKNRWKPGMMIDFFINNRTKNAFRFAPRVQVVSTQGIHIRHHTGHVEVFINGEWFGEVFHHGLDDIDSLTQDLELLAKNDGFNCVEDFFAYFDEDFTGKIIHWTNFKYE
ncbi:hypothetical protein CO230_08790 [Chryseobacterium sp. 6424]|uniref:hypothetical protein n=1 Tax=Chryseobacterium sp. 6424 TaxID=2039166 RepID=UPI000EFD9876|nr:hypothetical protein [Chryseobacterium sp. 6424]AYO58211.1 hypothetical protein CO230_08790 [Chryseobacterium sp. 6424]